MIWTIETGQALAYEEYHELEAACFSGDLNTRAEFASFDPADFWTIRDRGRLIAFMYVSAHGRSVHLKKIAVRAEYRRQGIATGLIREAAAFARRRGADTLTLSVLSANDAAMALYRALGFRAIGHRSRFAIPLADIPDSGGGITAERGGEGYSFRVRFLRDGREIGHGWMNTELGGCKDVALEDAAADLSGVLHALGPLLKKGFERLYIMTQDAGVIRECARRGFALDTEVIDMALEVCADASGGDADGL